MKEAKYYIVYMYYAFYFSPNIRNIYIVIIQM